VSFPEFIRAHREHREEVEERAAIMEYHAGMNRWDAEEAAVERMMDKYQMIPDRIRKQFELL
jgi:hypothetical protein